MIDEIDRPEVVAEVTAAFARYERALVNNDVAILDAMFRDDPRTICASPRAGASSPPMSARSRTLPITATARALHRPPRRRRFLCGGRA
jgi:hypothetical protein